MMFICENCIGDYEIRAPLETCLRSRGPCEACRQMKVCYDVPHGAYTRVVPRKVQSEAIVRSKTKDQVKATYGGIKFGEIVYLSPKIEEFLANSDALSMEMLVFKYGGGVGDREAIPFVRLHSLSTKVKNG